MKYTGFRDFIKKDNLKTREDQRSLARRLAASADPRHFAPPPDIPEIGAGKNILAGLWPGRNQGVGGQGFADDKVIQGNGRVYIYAFTGA